VEKILRGRLTRDSDASSRYLQQLFLPNLPAYLQLLICKNKPSIMELTESTSASALTASADDLSPLEQDVLDEYERLAENMKKVRNCD
jgi:hypothetical protein